MHYVKVNVPEAVTPVHCFFCFLYEKCSSVTSDTRLTDVLMVTDEIISLFIWVLYYIAPLFIYLYLFLIVCCSLKIT